MNKRYYEIIDTDHNEPQRSGQDVIESISKQLDELSRKGGKAE